MTYTEECTVTLQIEMDIAAQDAENETIAQCLLWEEEQAIYAEFG